MHLDLETNDLDFNINPKFAQKYEHRKKREELSQLEHKYASDESCSDIEDDDGVLVTPQVDAQILNTIALIRSKDAAVYDPKTVFFDDETEAPILEKPDKPITLKTYHQNELLNTEKPVVTHAQMQEDVKTEFLAAVKELDDSAEDIFTIRKHDKDEIKEQDKQYSKFLLENIDSSNPNVRAIEEWKQTTDPDEAFLLEYSFFNAVLYLTVAGLTKMQIMCLPTVKSSMILTTPRTKRP